jgi:acyl-CoA thioesterase-2
MPDLWTDLVDCLALRPVAPSVFEGPNQRLAYHRVFGGQILAQFVQAAHLTCPAKAVKSLHALFPRAGRTDEPIRYEVATQHEGATFATLTIVARQQKGVVATAAVSMHTAEDGPRHQSLPPPPALPGEEHLVKIDLLPWETRATADLDSPHPSPPSFEMWMRTPPVDPALAPPLAAYSTDLTLIGTALRPMPGVSQASAGTAFTSAVTSHTIWFHAPFRTDDWLLLRQHSPIVAHARCFGRGDLLAAGSGALVASYAQEALLRFPE